jgi:WhiB family transcriptional regulator, redox-sensing transcriptional regulator
VKLIIKFPAAIALDWQRRAACRDRDKSLFYGTSDGGTASDAARETRVSKAEHERIQKAQAVCSACPVRLACLRHAVNYPEKWGIWGGLTPTARAHLRTKAKKLQEARRAERRETEGGGHGNSARPA